MQKPVGVVLDMDGVVRQMDELASGATKAALKAVKLSLKFTTAEREQLRRMLEHNRRENLHALYAIAKSKTSLTELLSRPDVAAGVQELVAEHFHRSFSL